jgi:hypothetical protein
MMSNRGRLRADPGPGPHGHGVLFSAHSNGTGKFRLSPPRWSVIDLPFFDRIGADWSPDGSSAAFAAFNPSSNKTALFVVNANGTDLRRVTPLNMGAISAQWSPRGQNPTGGALYTVSRNGTGLFRVTKLPTFVFARGGAFFYS